VYVSDIFLRQLSQRGEELGIGTDASIDLFEKLPVPFGLVRYGVAPDHPAIKWIMGALEKTLDNPKIRLFSDVEFGTDTIRFRDFHHRCGCGSPACSTRLEPSAGVRCRPIRGVV
jgi:hypothetical protein